MPTFNDNDVLPPPIGPEDLPEAVILTDAENTVLEINNLGLSLLGFERAEFVGTSLPDVVPGIEAVADRLRDGAPTTAEHSLVATRKDGGSTRLGIVAAPLVRGDATIGFLYLCRDTRVHRLIENEVRKARDYYHSIFGLSPSGICITDTKRHVIQMNEAAEHICGRTLDELVGQSVVHVLVKKDEKILDLDEVRKGRMTREEEILRPDGEVIPVLVSYRIVGRAASAEEVIIETWVDQTDRKRLERLKNEFVYVAAHELRNPVTAMKLLLDLIFEDKRLKLDQATRDYLLKMNEANARLMQLVEDLLEVSRSEMGKLEIKVAPVDVEEQVHAIIDELKPTALAKEVLIEYEDGATVPKVLADASKLKEVLSNLISNAVKYNIAGGAVTVSHAVEGNVLATTVKDTGIGLKEEDKRRLFRKFWRSEDMAVRAQAGTGLGLFIVHELVERMGGTVRAESEYGKGTAFTFTLPLA